MVAVEIFGFAQSTFVRTACMVCEEKGIEYSIVPLKFGEESHRDVHPYFKMPALRHEDVSLFETLSIAIYLNEEFSGTNLDPGTIIARAEMYQWISASMDYVYEGIVGVVANSETVDSKVVDEAILLLQPFDQTLSRHDYLVGDELTLADLFLLPMLLFAQKAIGNSEWLLPVPNLASWLTHLADRPSVISTEA